MIINWYPGHMLKARRLITENLKQIDAVCEIIDARIPVASRNPDLDQLIGNKPRLLIFNRTDQADPAQCKKWIAFFRQQGLCTIETDSKSGKGVERLQSTISSLLSEKTSAYAQKGQPGRRIRLMIVGIPNVGKSSFINRAAKRKAAQASDKPGVTRGKQWIILGNGIELLDTPGVLWPKLDEQTIAENLAFTGAIRDDVMDIETLGSRLMERLEKLYPHSIRERYKINIDDIETTGEDGNDERGYEILSRAASARGFMLPGGHLDTPRMAAALLDEFRGGKLGRITLEWL